MNKRGQVFFIAALIIVGIVLSFDSISVSTKSSKEIGVESLAQEIIYESTQVADYSLAQGKTQFEINENIHALLAFYSLSHPDKEIVAIYGKGSKMNATIFTEGKEEQGTLRTSTQQINASFPSRVSYIYSFTLLPNEALATLIHARITQQRGNETYTATA